QPPSQAAEAPASAWQPPLQETSSLPPVHFGGFAFTSHFALPEHFAWQFAFALIDAEHFGGSNLMVSVPPAFALTVATALTATLQYAFIFSRLSPCASAASVSACGASRSCAIARQAVVMSSIEADAIAAKS